MFFKQRFQKFKEHKLELWKWQSIPILTLQGCEKNLSDLADMLTAYLHQGGAPDYVPNQRRRIQGCL